jgi:hypothetical protein
VTILARNVEDVDAAIPARDSERAVAVSYDDNLVNCRIHTLLFGRRAESRKRNPKRGYEINLRGLLDHSTARTGQDGGTM